jgi:hypothetical protein
MIRALTEIGTLMFFGWTVYVIANLIMGAA